MASSIPGKAPRTSCNKKLTKYVLNQIFERKKFREINFEIRVNFVVSTPILKHFFLLVRHLKNLFCQSMKLSFSLFLLICKSNLTIWHHNLLFIKNETLFKNFVKATFPKKHEVISQFDEFFDSYILSFLQMISMQLRLKYDFACMYRTNILR